MKRRKAREYALQFLYRLDFFDSDDLKNELGSFWNETGEIEPDIRNFASEIITGTIRNLEAIDSVIQKFAEKWTLSRIASIDRNILRFAAYELLYRKDIPDAVTINEALEIAKKYSTAESAAFINGILDRIAKEFKK